MDDLNFLDELIASFEKLPGVGKKTATRYALYIVEKMDNDDTLKFSNAILKAKKNISFCPICGMLTNNAICDICSDNTRDTSKIMVVKDSKDIIAMEKSHIYNGLYHSLNGLISPVEGVTPEKLNINTLERRINNNTKEVIISTSFTPQGETTALYIVKLLEKKNVNVSRISYGIPAGGDIDGIDELTLKRALENRIKEE